MFWLITIAVIFFTAIYFVIQRKNEYWKKKNIPHLKPAPIVGNYGDLILTKKTLYEVEQDICEKFADEPLIGTYYGTEPCLIVQDPHYIKMVTTKDFYYFSNREVSDYVHKELLTKNLFLSYGDEWKVLRQNLTPVFTSSKMKCMFTLIEKCSQTFEKMIDTETEISGNIEVRDLIGRFTMDCIGICAFGLNTEAMKDSKMKSENPFRNIGDEIFKIPYERFIQLNMRVMWPAVFYALGLKFMPKQVETFFSKLMFKVFDERREQKVTRNDFIDFVLNFSEKKVMTGDSMKNLKNGGKEKVSLDVNDELMAAQCFVFFAAGYETSATTASFTLYELAKDQKSQVRVLAEVDEFLKKHNGVLNYDCVTELPFLEQCVDETLRLYPVLGVITREVVEPYTFPDTNLTVEKGMRVHLPVHRVHRNPKYFKDPDTFKPERFSPEEKKNITPYSYLPFGEGPRICIGMRFAKMQMFAGLITILKKYRVELADKMPEKVDFEPKSIVTQSKIGIKLKFIPRTDIVPVMYCS